MHIDHRDVISCVADYDIVFTPYGDRYEIYCWMLSYWVPDKFSRWRLRRRIFHQSFRQGVISAYHPAILRSAHKMLLNFLQNPTNYTSHFHTLVTSCRTDLVPHLTFFRFTSSFMLSIIYAHEPETENDRIVHIMRNYMESGGAAGNPNATMIMETFPFRMSHMNIGMSLSQ